MGKSPKRTSNKHKYKRSNAKFYVKGNSKVERSEKIAETGARVIALLFYPAYLAVNGVKKLFKSNENQSKKHQASYVHKTKKSFNFSMDVHQITERVSGVLRTKILPYISDHKIVLASVTAAVLVTAVGLYGIGKLKPNDQIALDEQPTHVVSVAPKASDETENLEKEALTTEHATLQGVEGAVVSEPSERVGDVVQEIPQVKVLSAASVKTYQVLSNGKPVANFRTENEAERMLDALKAEFTSGTESEILEVYFYENVTIKPAYLDIVGFEGYDEVSDALIYVRKGTKQEKTHKVQKGENYWVIAQYYGVTPEDLEAANPNVKPEALQIGMEISLVVPKPLITVVTVENEVYSDRIAFDVTYESTSSLYKGESKTKVSGSYGERVIEAEVLKQNGREIVRKVLSEEVVKEPQTKVVYQGTKDPPPRIGTGTYIHPTSRGPVTSNFGWRTLRGKSDYHTGIDIGISTGTSVKAVDGGVVTAVGYNKSLGYYVFVDHGANVSSKYLHLSKILVSRGEKIFQGQTIAKSGNTGNSTGPHLHLEILINNVPQNPKNYIKF